MSLKRRKIRIEGTVQGIGFRPFVYKEAAKNSLSGHVFNDSGGVTIEVEGTEENLLTFAETVKTSPPPFAEIQSFVTEEIAPLGKTGFDILKSRDLGEANTMISPDIATCSECISDIMDTSNRRHDYPFTNCTNCGPRYTIIENVPYDRPATAMKAFKMCPTCEAEYTNPMDRRYHAQPNACPVCGPSLTLLDGNGKLVRSPKSGSPKLVAVVVRLLNEGLIVAIKGLGGFHLACDATNDAVVLELRRRKARDEKPFAVMIPDVQTVRRFCKLSAAEERILTSSQRPIVLLRKLKGSKIAASVAPNNSYLGVMLPYTPLHHLLLHNQRTSVLVMTSANLSDEPICHTNKEVTERLGGIADYYLIHNRDIHIRTDDSVTLIMNGKPLMIRRARGYAPQPIILKHTNIPTDQHTNTPIQLLAVGADLKNTVCLLKGNKAFVSQHIGDLENAAACESFEKTIGHLANLFDIKPTIIAHDMHPEYFSTKWASSRGNSKGDAEEVSEDVVRRPQESSAAARPLRLAEHGGWAGPFESVRRRIPVQHHHAHIASCMAENQLTGPVIGIALDGTGYGTDGNIWGGEILIATYEDFERIAHFEYVPLPGGDAAIKNPWQTAISYITGAGDIKGAVPSFAAIPNDKIELVLNMIKKGINSPLTSSCGRLFDAVAAIIGLRHTISFEGQAALELEMEAVKAVALMSEVRCPKSDVRDYPYKINKNNALYTISYMDTINAILEDIRAGATPPVIALRFHNTVAEAILDATLLVSRNRGLRDIALSGGCFQNVLLSEKLKDLLEADGMTVYTHSLVPPNDGGIALGQAAIAQAIMKFGFRT